MLLAGRLAGLAGGQLARILTVIRVELQALLEDRRLSHAPGWLAGWLAGLAGQRKLGE